jgi:hypothetical protein
VVTFVVSGVMLGAAALWGALLLGAGATHNPAVGDPADYGPLSAEQYAAAVRIARADLAHDHGKLTSATAIVTKGRVKQSDGHGACTSGRVLKVQLIGHFRHLAVSVAPGRPTGPDQAVVSVADAATGRACIVGVRLGHLSPYRHGADLLPALAHR